MILKSLGWTGLAALLTISSLFAQDASMYRGGPGHSGASGNLTFPIVQKWHWTGDGNTKSSSSPAVAGGVMYFGNGGKVFALRMETGAVVWEYPAGQTIPATFRVSPAIANGIVIAPASDASVYGISAENGRLNWQFNARGSISTAPTVVGNAAYVGTSAGQVYAIDTASGNPLWTEPFDARMAINGPLVHTGTYLLVLLEDGTLAGLVPSTGKVRFSVRLTGVRPDSYMVCANDQLYLNLDNGLVALNPSTGRQRWSKVTTSSTALSPVADDKRVFTSTQNGQVTGYDYTGKALWKEPIALPNQLQTSPTIAGDTLLLAARRGAFYAVDIPTGKIKWSYILRPPAGAKVSSGTTTKAALYADAASEAVVADDTLLLLTNYGQMYTFSSKGTADLTGPEMSYVLPEPGDVISGRPPLTFQCTVQDFGSGVIPESVQFLLDGNPLGGGTDRPVYDAQRGVIEYKLKSGGTARPLSDGRHKIEVRAKDWAGNASARLWEVTIDNTLSPVVPKSKNQETTGGGRGGG